MEKISRDNYEIWFIDYFDGTLDSRRREEFFEFLEANPDLKAEFEFYENTRVEPETTVHFSGKEKLKKQNINLQNYETWMIAMLENDLSGMEREEVLTFLKSHPHLEKELELFKSARLVPDADIVFPGRKNLRRSAIILSFTPTAKRVLSAAAVFLLLAISWILVNSLRPEGNQVAVQQEEVQPVPIASTEEKPVVKTAELKPVEKETRTKEDGVINVVPEPKTSHGEQFARVEEQRIETRSPNAQAHPGEDAEHKEEMERIPSRVPQLSIPQAPMASLEPEEEVSTPHINNGISHHHKEKALNMSDIFSKEELDELQASKDAGKDKDAESLVDLVLKKVKEVSRSKEVEFKTTKADKDNSITYALSVGNGFSISHTRTK